MIALMCEEKKRHCVRKYSKWKQIQVLRAKHLYCVGTKSGRFFAWEYGGVRPSRKRRCTGSDTILVAHINNGDGLACANTTSAHVGFYKKTQSITAPLHLVAFMY